MQGMPLGVVHRTCEAALLEVVAKHCCSLQLSSKVGIGYFQLSMIGDAESDTFCGMKPAPRLPKHL